MLLEHLHPRIHNVVELDRQARIQWIKEPRWIGYPRAQEVLSKLDDLVRHPKESRMPNMLLVGRTNNGKTKLVRHFANLNQASENPEGEHIIAPVIYIQAPPSPSEAGFYSEILGGLFETVPAGSTDVKRAKVINILERIQLKVLIIDELHNVLAGASVRQQQFLNMIKYLSNQLQISIVGCGTGDLLRAVSVDSQIENRFVPEILPQWQMNKEYRQLLASFEALLPLKERSFIYNAPLAGKILAMAEGTIGEISMLLNSAAEYVLLKGKEKIEDGDLNQCGYVSPSERKARASRV
ncbi:TniB family NTP-binding protein [Microbulbifer sp. VAAF005]|uniref:TniB family NTP-binding protein n=1 Tax=Microbulbifer sp. VAAF005 TaxID=3034230 RepID=UPI0024ACF683|nr:TniB family NTP-binding protein [Microbulbifer sp. VAAF005]WHI44627.1 TniB family NTP-binding protein [Microbulbifer sp. VAAF005]